jgi:hypothetical protein
MLIQSKKVSKPQSEISNRHLTWNFQHELTRCESMA